MVFKLYNPHIKVYIFPSLSIKGCIQLETKCKNAQKVFSEKTKNSKICFYYKNVKKLEIGR